MSAGAGGRIRYTQAGIYGMKMREIKAKTQEAISELGLENEKRLLVQSLPLGIKQKISFAVSTFHSPKIIFLDEPAGGVDPISRRLFREMIYKASSKGMTAFVTTHYMDEAEYCNRVSIMVDGQIKEIYHIIRDPLTLSIMLILPVLLVLILGFAVTAEIRNTPVAVLIFPIDSMPLLLRLFSCIVPARRYSNLRYCPGLPPSSRKTFRCVSSTMTTAPVQET